MDKIKRKIIIAAFWLISGIILLFTRFVGLDWGLPYPMHPDERNMAVAVSQLKCEIKNPKFRIEDCMNPHFFAYGQLPLYFGFAVAMILKFFTGDLGSAISFEEAAMSLRLISASASVLASFILLKIVRLILEGDFPFAIRKLGNKDSLTLAIKYKIAFLITIFSPFFIQFAHFGTTESLLMLFYSGLAYFCLNYSLGYWRRAKFLIITAVILAGAIATKTSSLIFLAAPLMTILFFSPKTEVTKGRLTQNFLVAFFKKIVLAVELVYISAGLSIIFSPHNFISFSDFYGAMRYESDVALGRYVVFYSRQFIDSLPVLFQLTKIFPYALGWPVFIFGLLGFFCLSWTDRKINLLRLIFLSYFLPVAFVFTKWVRFMAPILPIILVFAVLILFAFSSLGLRLSYWINRKWRIKDSKLSLKTQTVLSLVFTFTIGLFIFAFLLPGIAYISVYTNPDVRFLASEWIFKNIPAGSFILSETANVIDIPISSPKSKVKNQNYNVISFNFYDLDDNAQLPYQLKTHLAKADFILVPSRRIFMNYYCGRNFQFTTFNFKEILNSAIVDQQKKCQFLRKRYPLLNDYYDKLFDGRLGFIKIAQITSYPRIQFLGITWLEFPDEKAEESWTVFDHPVIRIYKRAG